MYIFLLNVFLLQTCTICKFLNQECHVTGQHTSKKVPFQSSSGRMEDKQEGGTQCQHIPVHSGRRALPDHRRIHPLFSCSQSLLVGPADENEGLWHQHTHYVRRTSSNVRVLFLDLMWSTVGALRSICLQVCTVESAPTRERGFQLQHTTGFGVRRCHIYFILVLNDPCTN